MEATRLGNTALVGWREKVAKGVAGPVSNRSRFDEDQVKAVVGALFFLLSLYYVVATIRRMIAEAR